MKNIIISIDLMGGDDKIKTPLSGISKFLEEIDSSVRFLAYGTKEAKDFIPTALIRNIEFIESESYIKTDDDPALALRRGRNSSMFMAIKSVSEKISNASVSAGNTGALMAMSKMCFKTSEGIDRPAIATIIPTQGDFTLLLDMGANIECEPKNLYEFAIMGQAFVTSVCGISKPTVGILNIGSEPNKGRALEKNSYVLFKEKFDSSIFKGFIEGDKIAKGVVNVIVCDGFSGNIALKTLEGAGSLMIHYLKFYFKSSVLSKIGYLLAKPALKQFSEKMDPNNYNGALFLGLNGISIKSHGSANAKGFKNAIDVAYKLVKNNIITNISNNIEK
jgi:glycerol-3-phosphate acyltransferase PlsX